MKKRILGILLCTFFVALIATPMVIKHVSKRHESIGAVPLHETVTDRYGSISRRSPKLLALILRIKLHCRF